MSKIARCKKYIESSALQMLKGHHNEKRNNFFTHGIFTLTFHI